MASTNYSKSQLTRLLVPQLKEQLQKLGLPITGLKKDLVDRLFNAYQELSSSNAEQPQQVQDAADNAELNVANKSQTDQPVVVDNPPSSNDVPASEVVAETQPTVDDQAQIEEAERMETQRQQLLEEREKLYSSYLSPSKSPSKSPTKSPVKRIEDDTKAKEVNVQPEPAVEEKVQLIQPSETSVQEAVPVEQTVETPPVKEQIPPTSEAVEKSPVKQSSGDAKTIGEKSSKNPSKSPVKQNEADMKALDKIQCEQQVETTEKREVPPANLEVDDKSTGKTSEADPKAVEKVQQEQLETRAKEPTLTPNQNLAKSEPVVDKKEEEPLNPEKRSVRKLKIHRKGSSSDLRVDVATPPVESPKAERKPVKHIEPPKDSDKKQERKPITPILAPNEKSVRVVKLIKNEVALKEEPTEQQPAPAKQPNGKLAPSASDKIRTPKIEAKQEAAKESTPPRNPPSAVLFVSNLTRPFTIPRLYEFLSKDGNIQKDRFWIDKIKSKCIVMYTSVEEATAARASLHGQRWPDSNPKLLSVDFSSEKEFEEHIEGDKAPAVAVKAETDKRKETKASADKYDVVIRKESGEGDRRDSSKRPVREWDREKLEKDRETSPTQKRRRSRSPKRDDRNENLRDDKRAKVDTREQNKPVAVGEESPAKLLDDLFNKTKAVPCIYWLPLTEEQSVIRAQVREENEKKRKEEIAARDAERAKHQEEARARRMANSPRGRSPFADRGGFRGNRGGPPGRRPPPPFRDNRSPPRRRRTPSSSRSRSRSKSRSPVMRGRPGPPPPPHMRPPSRSPRRSPPRRYSPPRRNSPPRRGSPVRRERY